MPRRIPAIIYAAKSTEDVHGSIATQIADCEAEIQRLGDRSIVKTFVDEAQSAYRRSRGPGLNEAREAAADAALTYGGAELWVQHSDRLARGDAVQAAHLVEYALWARKNNVRIRSVQDDRTFEGLIYAVLMGERAFEDSRRKSEAVRSGKARQFQRGERLGGPVLDGFKRIVDPDETEVQRPRYVRDPERAPIIERVFELALAGYGDQAIARQLNARGLRTTSGGAWTRRRIQDLLTNPLYAGRVSRRRGTSAEETRPATNVETLIAPERFDAIQDQRRQRNVAHGAHRSARDAGRPTTRYALAKLARCARCGSKMYVATSPYKRKDGSHARWYVCAHVRNGTGLCDAPKVNAEATDASLLLHLSNILGDYTAWRSHLEAESQAQTQAVTRRADDLQHRLARLEHSQQPAHDKYVDALAAGDDAKAEAALSAMTRIDKDAAIVRAAIEDAELELKRLADEHSEEHAATFWSHVIDAVLGRLGAAETMADLNAALRASLTDVLIDTLPDGAVRVDARFRKPHTIVIPRGVWKRDVIADASGLAWLAEGGIGLPSSTPTPDAHPSETAPHSQAYRRTKWNAPACRASHP